MHRLLVESRALESAEPSLPPEAARHLRVLRVRDGETVELFDGRGSWREFACRRATGGGLSLAPCAPRRFLPRRADAPVLFACVTKGARWDWTVEKATELGVARIVPVIGERTVVRIPPEERAAKAERWRRIAAEAARQSDAKWLPEIPDPVRFADALPLVKATRCFAGILSDPPPPPIAAALASAASAGGPGDGRPFAAFTGPEGDFSPEERDALSSVAAPVSLGPTILRAETAAIYAVSAIKAFLEGASA